MKRNPELDELLSVLYHSLRATRRRYVIQFLENAGRRSVTTRELARKIASLELKVPEPEATGESYRNAYNALSQTHLPTLSDAGIVIYDPKRQVVTKGDNFHLAVLLIDTNTPTVNVFSSLSEESG
jgi:hypothetical protein